MKSELRNFKWEKTLIHVAGYSKQQMGPEGSKTLYIRWVILSTFNHMDDFIND